MPLYEYRCGKCSEVFETLVRGGSNGGAVKCPRCGSRKSEKLFSVFASHGTAARASSGAACSSCSSGNCATCGH